MRHDIMINQNGGRNILKFSQLLDKSVWANDLEIGKIRDLVLDPVELKLTHLEVQLRSEATKEVLGAKKSFRNLLSVSALKKDTEAISKRGVELQVSKAQLRIYLTPP